MINFEHPSGVTPLDPDEIDGLIPLHISTQSQLNEWEAVNILKAENWAFSAMHHESILSARFVILLHKRMFDESWRWAGQFRRSNRNIGIDFPQISSELAKLLGDVVYQITHRSMDMDEIACRFHHRLVAIHPFPNGNGRHARMMTDILLVQAGSPRFTWGKTKLGVEGPVRRQYIDALKEADRRDYTRLKRFVRS